MSFREIAGIMISCLKIGELGVAIKDTMIVGTDLEIDLMAVGLLIMNTVILMGMHMVRVITKMMKCVDSDNKMPN